MIKIDLITGFLGSGKTTFLKKYARYLINQGLNICILENDYGAVNVDMMLLNDLVCENCNIEMVSGGCDSNCHRRRFKTKLIAMGMKKYDRVLIEPSGIFDVDEFYDSLYDEPLCNWYEIGNVFTIVDANELFLDDDSKYVLGSEVSSSGRVLLSKINDNTDISKITNYLNDTLKFIGCNETINNRLFVKKWDDLKDDDFKILINSGYCESSFIKKEIVDYSSIYFMNKKYNQAKIKELIKELFDSKKYGEIIRVKGFYMENDSWYQLNATKNELTIAKIDKGQEVIIIIGRELNTENINSLFN